MTVIAGYLGAGKTTLINRILAAPHGLRLLVMVNDFGAVNIDEALLASRDEDTIALSNGCVCCTMGADLFMAIGDALDRKPRPDHLIIEASGVSDPARIANAAVAEPELSYAGIVTVADGPAFAGLASDPLIGPQIRAQAAAADLVWVSKEPSAAQVMALQDFVAAPILVDGDPAALLRLVSDTPPGAPPAIDHAHHVSWHMADAIVEDINVLRNAFSNRPRGLFRVKGTVQDRAGGVWQVQVVGRQITITPAPDLPRMGLVGIGLADTLNIAEVAQWWSSHSTGP